MKTELLNIDRIPNRQELLSLLGEKGYKFHHILSDKIITLLEPDIELWDHAGRRGKYLHGFRANAKFILVDIYLYSTHGNGQLRCEIKLQKKSSRKILKRKESFCEKTQNSIMTSEKAMKKYGGFYLDLVIDKETMPDTISIIEIVS